MDKPPLAELGQTYKRNATVAIGAYKNSRGSSGTENDIWRASCSEMP